MDLKLLEDFLNLINFDDSFCVAVIAIIFNPLFWNVVRATADYLYCSSKIILYILLCSFRTGILSEVQQQSKLKKPY